MLNSVKDEDIDVIGLLFQSSIGLLFQGLTKLPFACAQESVVHLQPAAWGSTSMNFMLLMVTGSHL